MAKKKTETDLVKKQMQNRTEPVEPNQQILTEARLKIHLTAFSEYTSITPDAVALILRKGHGDKFFSGTPELSGLTSLSDDVAECISLKYFCCVGVS